MRTPNVNRNPSKRLAPSAYKPPTNPRPPENRLFWKAPLLKEESSRASPSLRRTSAPASQSISPNVPRSAALPPQPRAGVAYSSFEGVADTRLGAIAEDALIKSLSRNHSCARQPSASGASGDASVALPVTPFASEYEKTVPEARRSS